MTSFPSAAPLREPLLHPVQHGLLAPLRRHWRAYLFMNGVFYGLVLLAMLVTSMQPSLQASMINSVKTATHHGILSIVADAYRNQHLVLAIVLTFLINLILGSVLQVHLPSMIVPFLGLLVVGFRALSWGVMFCPFTGHYGREIIPHYLTTLLEGQAYVLAMLAAYVQGTWVLPHDRPRGQVYVEALAESLRIYRLVALVLAVSAVYEVVEVIYLAPLLKR